MPSQDIAAYKGKFIHQKLLRPSYLNVVLIQSRGRPRPERRQAPGFDGCCANCKWRDHSARCSLAQVSDDEEEEEEEEDGDRLLSQGNELVEVIEISSDED
ncbi:hypothetical protein VTI74DRAFT_4634 [Chaetomium olivicolor]